MNREQIMPGSSSGGGQGSQALQLRSRRRNLEVPLGGDRRRYGFYAVKPLDPRYVMMNRNEEGLAGGDLGQRRKLELDRDGYVVIDDLKLDMEERAVARGGGYEYVQPSPAVKLGGNGEPRDLMSFEVDPVGGGDMGPQQQVVGRRRSDTFTGSLREENRMLKQMLVTSNGRLRSMERRLEEMRAREARRKVLSSSEGGGDDDTYREAFDEVISELKYRFKERDKKEEVTSGEAVPSEPDFRERRKGVVMDYQEERELEETGVQSLADWQQAEVLARRDIEVVPMVPKRTWSQVPQSQFRQISLGSQQLQMQRQLQRLDLPICCLKHSQGFMANLRDFGGFGNNVILTLTYSPNCQPGRKKRCWPFLFNKAKAKDKAKRIEHRKVITDLIKIYGRNVAALNCFPCGSGLLFETVLEWYTALVEWIKLMPDLEELKIFCDFKDTDLQLSSLVESQAFPKLAKLKHLYSSRMVEPALRSLLLENCQISSFQVVLPDNQGNLFKAISLPNLTDLRVSCNDIWDQRLESVAQLHAPKLQKLQLNFGSLESEPYTSGVVHRILKNFQKTLTEVKFEAVLNLEHGEFQLFPTLPELKKLELRMDFERVVWNPDLVVKLVEPLQNLEILKLREYKDSGTTAKSVQLYHKPVKQLLIDRLLQLLPKLMDVVVDSATKRDYEGEGVNSRYFEIF